MTESPSPSRDARRATDRGALLAGLFALALLTVVWSWWAWQEGAWFGVVLLPGGILLCAGLLVLVQVAPRRVSLRLGPPAGVALAALIALGGWTALSALWSPAANVAVADAQRVLLYAVAFGLGFWIVALLGARRQLALVPLATAGAFAGVITVVGMITTDTPGTFLEEGTLEYPIGYRNANAAFFLVAFFPALGLAADRHLDWRARGPALAAATLCAGLAMLSQSRGSVPAALIAVAAYLVLSPLRLRAICWLLLAAIPAITVIPALTDLFQAVSDDGPRAAATGELEAAGIAVGRAAVASLLLGAAATRFERLVPGLGSTSPRANRGIAGTLAVGAAAALAAFLVAVGDPIDWTVKRADEFRSGTPELGAEASRFTFNLGTDRYDLWRVALGDAGSEPLRGTGAGGFQYSYLRERESETQTARDAHSVELEVLGELGIPGLALVLTALGAATVGALRSRRLGERQAALSAIALAAGAYWLAHASIDWFWPYPAITAPVLALLGAACAGVAGNGERGAAPAEVDVEGEAAEREHASAPPRMAARLAIAAGAIVIALSAVPPFLSERYVNQAYEGWGTDLDRAYEDLDRARALNPLTDAPLLAEGGIADAAGDRERAIAAFRSAAEKRPEEWGAHFLLAELLARDRPALARRELDLARELNPNSPELDELEDRLAEASRRRQTEPDAQPD